jgi:hypothetical protein
MNRLTSVLAPAVVLAALTASLAGSTTTASATIFHMAEVGDQEIQFPQSGHRCIPKRKLRIGGGRHIWTVEMAHAPHRDNKTQRTKRLKLPKRSSPQAKTDMYVWRDCFDFPGGKKPLRQWSTLRNLRTKRSWRVNNGPVYGRYGDGIYFWGSTLSRPR